VNGVLTIREEQRPREFQNRVMRRILVPKWEEVTGDWKKFHTEKLVICTSYGILFRQSNQGLYGMNVQCKERQKCIQGCGSKT
jgi:hypothetical protein